MRMNKKGINAFLLGCLITMMGASTAWAATKTVETRTPIQTVTLNVTSVVRDGDESGYITATGTSDAYTIGNYEWSKTTGVWQTGDVPKVKVYLHARSGYYFEKTTSKTKVLINGAEYASAKINDNKETLVISLKLVPVSGTLEEPEFAEWVGYPIGKATWSKPAYAEAYQLMLYYDEQAIITIDKTIGETFDFYPYMTKAGDYYFRVKAVPKDTLESGYITSGNWVSSDTYTLENEDTPAYKYNWDTGKTTGGAAPIMGWQQNSSGWWYAQADGSYPKSQWSQIDGKWYLFDANGYMQTGWQQNQGKWYYLSVNGDMQTGWFQNDRKWYYLGADGAAAVGWNTIDGKRYYMNSQGEMLTGWWLLDGGWRYFDTNTGAMQTNITIGGHYLDQNGIWNPS